MGQAKYRADHIGSLLRPNRLLEAMRNRSASGDNRTAPQELTKLQDDAIMSALDHQRDAGVQIFTDGEFRRVGFMTGFVDAVEGFAEGQVALLEWKGGNGSEPASPNAQAIRGRLEIKGRIAGDEARFMQEHAPGPFKITLPSPATFAFTSWQPDQTAYATRGDFIGHAGELLAEEAGRLGDEGVAYIQVDAPNYTHFADPVQRERLKEQGVDDGVLDSAIAADNAILNAARTKDLVTGVHLCRGNSMGRWLAEGGYEPVAEKLFNELRCDRLLLEYDDARSGGFEPLRLVPRGKLVVLGLISSKRAELEARDVLMRRIEEASKYLPLDQLALSPQCGFASSGRGNPLTEDEQWRKLALVTSVSQEVWGSG